MLTYKANELMSSTEVAKNFGAVLAKLASREVEKIGVLKNNKLDYVLLRSDEIDTLVKQETQKAEFENNKRYVAEQLALSYDKSQLMSFDEAVSAIDKVLDEYED